MTKADAKLVLEGALSPGGVAVLVDRVVAAHEALEPGPRAAADLFGAARRALARAGVATDAVAEVVVDVGPGSFTGLRVALGLARGLAFGLAPVRLVGVDAPRVLAEAAGARLPVWVLIPWGRLRALAVSAGAEGPRDGAVLAPLERLKTERRLAGRRVVVPPQLADLELPADVRRIVAHTAPVLALAEIGARGAARPGAAPRYVVPPDAALPARGAFVPAGFSLVELSGRDLGDLAQLERACFRQPWSAGMLREELTGDPGQMALGVRGPAGALEAAVLARVVVDEVSIASVAVAPPARGLGLARALVREVVARARRQGAVRADLEVRVDNAAAIALYASEGFVPVGLRRRYYQDGADALLMSLALRRKNGAC